jgi:hypothetical protein
MIAYLLKYFGISYLVGVLVISLLVSSLGGNVITDYDFILLEALAFPILGLVFIL